MPKQPKQPKRSRKRKPSLPKPGETWTDKNPGYYCSRQGGMLIEVNIPDTPHRFLSIEEVVLNDPLGRDVRGTLSTGEHFTAPIAMFTETWEKTNA